MRMIGRIHSIESCGTVDGPGVRFVVFMQGCPLRCVFCHNPDTWDPKGGSEVSVAEIMEELQDYLPYMEASGGGLTVSGGEPLLQPEFILELFRECKKQGIHTALDTAGSVIPSNLEEILQLTDLVLLDIKHIDEQMHKEITGLSNRNTLKFAQILSDKRIPTWLRHVLVPGYTTSEEDLIRLGEYISTLGQIEKVEVLPYHKMGEYKWEVLGLSNKLTDIQPPSEEMVNRAYELLTRSIL